MTVDPSALHTIESLHEDTGVPLDTLYDLMRVEVAPGRQLGFKIGRRWFVHPDDWDTYIAARRGVLTVGSPTAPAVKPSRRAS